MSRVALTLSIAAALSLQATTALAAKATIVLRNDGKLARPAETIVIPFADSEKALPDLIFDQVIVRDDQGHRHPSQVTAMKHIHKGPAEYDDLIFQRDFRANEQRVTVTIESTTTPQPPFPSKVWAGLRAGTMGRHRLGE